MKSDFEDYMVNVDDSGSSFDSGEGRSSPEKRLLYAICERTVRDLFSSSEEERQVAEEWLNDNEGNNPFSFPWVCEVLDLNREHLLEKIKSLQQIGVDAPNASREIYFLIDRNNAAYERKAQAA